MKPIKQRNRHNPEKGIWGDCHRAAIASVLEMSLDEVPHFFDGGCSVDDAGVREREFLREHGLVPITAVFAGDLDEGLRSVAHLNPNVYYLLGGTSRTGVAHTVVCLNDQIVHDPSLDDSGIIGPGETSQLYWVTFFGAARLEAECASF